MELTDPSQYTIAGVLFTVGMGFLSMCWKSGKWLATRLFDEKTGYVTRMTEGHMRLVDALQTLPASIQQIQATDVKQTSLLKQIVESQIGETSHPVILQEKINLMIEANIRIKQAYMKFIDNKHEESNGLLDEAEHLLNKARLL